MLSRIARAALLVAVACPSSCSSLPTLIPSNSEGGATSSGPCNGLDEEACLSTTPLNCCPGLVAVRFARYCASCRPASNPTPKCSPEGDYCYLGDMGYGMQCCGGLGCTSGYPGRCISGAAQTGGASSIGGTSSTPPPWTAVAIGAGNDHTCALVTDGTVRCWGNNADGQLGNGSTVSSTVPVQVDGITDAISLAVGSHYNCALLRSGSIECWGDNRYGQFGNGNTVSSSFPVSVYDTTDAIIVAAGGCHTCAVLSSRAAECWGCGSCQLGFNGGDTTLPTALVGLSGDALAVSGGRDHSCAVLTGGTMQCWGDNSEGELGNGAYSSFGPCVVSVSNISNAVAVATGADYTCALLSNGTPQCWGKNDKGQLGLGTTENSNVPVTVPNLSNANALSADAYHTCVVLGGGSIQCWGYNYWGELGNGTTTDSLVPIEVAGISNAVTVAAGLSHTCAILAGGSVQCWGQNTLGQLGDGTTTDTYLPVRVRNFEHPSDFNGED